jgi:L-threonylcarbamoyladenylate synthase
MKTEIMQADHPVAFHHALDVLKNGGVLAFPTDTVYGLAAFPFEETMVERLYVVKGRNSTKAIAILIGNLVDLKQIVRDMPPLALCLARHFWPGPLTLVLPSLDSLPKNLSSNTTIGVRMPDHPVALTLLKQAGPLAVTSANMSGQGNTKTAQEVLEQLGGRIHLILDGGTTPGGVPSTVVDCTDNELVILREGPLTLKDLQAVL